MHHFRYAAEYRHFPHDGREPFAAHGYLEMAFCVLSDVQFPRIEAVALQEGEIPEREEDAALLEEFDFVIGNHHVAHLLELAAQHVSKAFRVNLRVAVKESVLNLRPRVGFKNVILTGKGIKVIVSEMSDDSFVHDCKLKKSGKVNHFLNRLCFQMCIFASL